MRRSRPTTHADASAPRPSRRIYREEPGKLREPVSCPGCGASYRNGRWTWDVAPEEAAEHVCPACKRIDTGYPAGVLHVAGKFAAANRGELENLVRNLEERESAEHPLKRIMDITDDGSGFTVTVTDGDLAMAFGRALERAYDGRLEHPPTTSEKENLVRVSWTRD